MPNPGWYTTGSVTLAASTAVVGSGTSWTSQLNQGDMFTADHQTMYQVMAIIDDTHLTLDRAFAGTVGAGLSYAVIRNFTNATNSDVAARLAATIAANQAFFSGQLLGRWPDGSVAAPTVSFINDTTTGFYRTVDGSNNTTGIGVTIAGVNVFTFGPTGASEGFTSLHTSSPVNIFGAAAATGIGGHTQGMEVLGTGAGMAVGRWTANNAGVPLSIYKSRGATVGAHGAVVPGDLIMLLAGVGDDGTNITTSAANINISVDPLGTVSTGVVPGQITLATANPSGAMTTALTIDRNQTVTFVDGSTVGASGFAGGPALVPAATSLGYWTFSPTVTSTAATNLGFAGVQSKPTWSASGIGSAQLYGFLAGGAISGSFTKGGTATFRGYSFFGPGSAGAFLDSVVGFSSSGINNGGNTSGTISNYGMIHNTITGAAAAGGIQNNIATQLFVGTGSGAGTTTNYGLYVTGNGGSGGSGTTTNWGIYSDSTANNALAGKLFLGYTTSNGSYPLQVNGQIFATSATIATSDAQFKDGIVSISTALPLIMAMTPREFVFVANDTHNFPAGRQIGFIAQEVQTVLAGTDYANSLVFTNSRAAVPAVEAQAAIIDEEGNVVSPAVEAQDAVAAQSFLGLADNGFTPLIVRAMQEMEAQILALQTQVAALQAA